MSTNDEILEHVKRRAGDPTTRTDNEDLRANEIVAPATEAEITVAESAFGVQLPLVLRQLYTRIGNGGFGPGYGLLGVPPHGYRDDQRHTGLELYALFSQFDPDDAAWDWPDAL